MESGLWIEVNFLLEESSDNVVLEEIIFLDLKFLLRLKICFRFMIVVIMVGKKGIFGIVVDLRWMSLESSISSVYFLFVLLNGNWFYFKLLEISFWVLKKKVVVVNYVKEENDELDGD